MAKYKETVHTDKAFALIGKMVAGKISELEFTKIKVSDKDYSKHTAEELKKLTALEQIKQETEVSEKTLAGDNAVNVHGIIYNTDLQNSYYLRTLGLYANDPDEGEILYSVTATEVGDYIPTPNGNNITTAIIDILTEISDAEVNLSGNPSALVDVSMLNKKLDRGEGLEKEFDSAVKIVTELKKKQNKEDSTLKTVVKTIVGAINELFDNKLEKGGYTGTAQNLLTEISKIASKSVLGRIIIGKGISVDSSGRTSIVSKNDGIIVNENDIQLDTVDNVTTDSGTKPLSARQGKKLEENKQNKNDNTLKTTAKNIVGAINELFSEKANKAHSHGNSEITDIDASKIKTGTIDISRLPQAALERCVVVADDTARFKLTKEQVQVGDSVKVTNPDNLMYIVVDDTKLNVEAGYVAYSAAIKWDGIKDKPSVFPPSSHTHTKNQITDFAHTHDDRYYTEAEIDTKFKNFSLVAVPIGGILFMYNTSNPAELYAGTTWELLPDNKFLKTGSSPHVQGGSNSVKIAKANLPAEKLQVESHSMTRGTMEITGIYKWDTGVEGYSSSGAFTNSQSWNKYGGHSDSAAGYTTTTNFNASRSWSGSTSSASPYTTAMGSGTPLSINPEHITIKAWKRLS